MRRLLRLGLAVSVALALVWLARTPDAPLDRTHIDSGVVRQVRPVLQLIYSDEQGRTARALVDAARYSQFVQDAVRQLEADRLSLRDGVAARIGAGAAPSFAA